jgi:CrcB protein
MIYLLIALGGAIGSVSRYALGSAVQRMTHHNFPLGTLIVNVSGCLLIGVLAKFFMGSQTELPLRATLMIGFCGGFTTFSSFTLETLALAQTGAWARAALYVAMSMVICLAATAAGFAIGKPLNP